MATILDESLGRCAINWFPAKTGVTANLEVEYKRPVVTNSFYVIKCQVEKLRASDTKAWVKGSWEGLDGRVLAEGKALFVVPKNVVLRKMEDF